MMKCKYYFDVVILVGLVWLLEVGVGNGIGLTEFQRLEVNGSNLEFNLKRRRRRRRKSDTDSSPSTSSSSETSEVPKPNSRSKPHIILSLADDLGYYDIGYRNSKIHSPTLDGLAMDGIRLSRHYTNRFCSPSRMMLLSGVNSYRHGHHTDLNLNPVSLTPCAVQERFKLLPEILKGNGYATHMVGKWHLGHFAPKFTPISRGFDSFVGFYSGGINHMSSNGTDKLYTTMFGQNMCTCDADDHFRDFTAVKCNPNVRSFCANAFELINSTASDGIHESDPNFFLRQYDYADELLGDEAVRIIHNHNGQRNPLFLYVAWAAPHAPTQAPDRYVKLNKRMAAAMNRNECAHNLRLKYAGMISALDAQHAKIVNALKQKRMWDNTILIFLSDNGGHHHAVRKKSKKDCNSHGPMAEKSGRNYPLRGGKFSFWEGGIRTVSFVHSPNPHIIPEDRRGASFKGLFSVADWPFTVLTAIGIEAQRSDTFGKDSESIWTQMIKGDPSPRQNITVQLFRERGRYVYIYRDPTTDKLYKYMEGYPGNIKSYGYAHSDNRIIKNDESDRVSIPEELKPGDKDYDAGLINNNRKYDDCVKKPCLYELTSDPGERKSLIKDKSVSHILAQIRADLDDVKFTEMPFVGSDLCFPGAIQLQATMETSELYDPNAVAMATNCGFFVPWQSNKGTNLKSPQCPPMLKLAPGPRIASPAQLLELSFNA